MLRVVASVLAVVCKQMHQLPAMSGAGVHVQGLQILLMSGVCVTSASQILESFWNIWSQVSDFPAHGRGMYTLL